MNILELPPMLLALGDIFDKVFFMVEEELV